MTSTLSTRMTVPELGDDEVELSVDYDYNRRHRELTLHNCLTVICGAEIDVWGKLTQTQQWEIEERCEQDYIDRMEAAVEQRYEERHCD